MGNLGATGEFPQGRLNTDDEGELQLGVAADLQNRKVVVQFGTPVKWFAMDPEGAEQFAEMLLNNAQKARGVVIAGGDQ